MASNLNPQLGMYLLQAAAEGDTEAVQSLLSKNIDVNTKHSVNGWTPLHWACRRGYDEIVRILLNNGADAKIESSRGKTPADVCSKASTLALLGETGEPSINNIWTLEEFKFVPHFIQNPPLNGLVNFGPKLTHDFASMPTTALPTQTDDLVLKIRIAGSIDPDYIEVEVPRWKLTYAALIQICCDELEVAEGQIERLRKMPHTRLRKDADVKRLRNMQCLEVVLKAPVGAEKISNSYQSISTHKNQTILY